MPSLARRNPYLRRGSLPERIALGALAFVGVWTVACGGAPYADPSKQAKAESKAAPAAPAPAAKDGAGATNPGARPQEAEAPAKEAAPDSKATPAAVGTPAPDFRVRDDEGREVALADFRGKAPVLLLFYPKDFTSGCTVEMSNFGAKHDLFASMGVEVFGVSIDPPERHHAFRESLHLPFPLLADEDGALSEAYGALAQQGDAKFSLRKVVLIDRNGVVAYRDESYRVGDGRDFDAVVEAARRVSGGGEAAGAKNP